MTEAARSAPDPFIEEADRHEWKVPILAPWQTRATWARDSCRSYADGEMCDHCADLIKAFDDALFGAFMGGTGPFA